jgi:hypothetical protein
MLKTLLFGKKVFYSKSCVFATWRLSVNFLSVNNHFDYNNFRMFCVFRGYSEPTGQQLTKSEIVFIFIPGRIYFNKDLSRETSAVLKSNS